MGRASALTTLPLTFSLFIVGLRPCPEIVDETLAVVGLVRKRAQERSVQVLRERTRQQHDDLRRSEAARHAAERLLEEARSLYARRDAGGPTTGARESVTVLWALNVASLAVVALARLALPATMQPLERKVVEVALYPALLLRFVLWSGGVRRPRLESLDLVLLAMTGGYCSHILLLSLYPRA